MAAPCLNHVGGEAAEVKRKRKEKGRCIRTAAYLLSITPARSRLIEQEMRAGPRHANRAPGADGPLQRAQTRGCAGTHAAHGAIVRPSAMAVFVKEEEQVHHLLRSGFRRNFHLQLRFRTNVHPSAPRVKAHMSLSARPPPGRASMGRLRHLPAPRGLENCPRKATSSDTLPPPPPLSIRLCSPPRPRLSRRAQRAPRQRLDPPQHGPEKPPRQVTLRQQEPVVPRVLDQPAARLHPSLLQAGQPPVAHAQRQRMIAGGLEVTVVGALFSCWP